MPVPDIRFKGLPPVVPKAINKAELLDEMNDSVRSVAEALAGVIALPQMITVKFGKDKKSTAMADPGVIELSPESFKYLGGRTPEGASIFCGVVAHEFSHLSDFFTGNSRSRGRVPIARKVVEEGKACHVGVFIGGEGYSEVFVEPLLNAEKEDAYNDLLLSQNNIYAAKRRTERSLKIGLETPLSRFNGAYDMGFALIEDVLDWTGNSSLFDIHEKSHIFFMDALQEHVKTRATIPVVDMPKEAA